MTDPKAAKKALMIARAGGTLPERRKTLETQREMLIHGGRSAILYPTGTEPLSLPKGMARLRTKDGEFHYNPKRIDPKAIEVASRNDRLNDVLGMGPYSKADVAKRVMKGETPLAVVARDKAGHEAISAAGTQSTAPVQKAALKAQTPKGGSVDIEPIQRVLAQRLGARA